MIKDARPQTKVTLSKIHSVSSSSPPITMPDPTLSIPVPSEDSKPKKKEEPESNDAKQKQKGEKEQEDLVCLSSVPHPYNQELRFPSRKRTFNSRMSSKCLWNVSGYATPPSTGFALIQTGATTGIKHGSVSCRLGNPSDTYQDVDLIHDLRS